MISKSLAKMSRWTTTATGCYPTRSHQRKQRRRRTRSNVRVLFIGNCSSPFSADCLLFAGVVVALVFLFSFFFGYLVGYVNSKSSTMLASSPSVPPSLALPSSLAAPPPPPYVRAAWLPAYSLDQLAPLQRSVFFDTQTAAPVARLGQVVLDPATGVAWLCMGLSGLGHGPAFDLSNTLIAHRVVFPELNATHLAISASSQGWVSSAGDCRVDKIMTRLSPGTLAHVSVVFDPSLGGCPVGAAYDASTKSVAIALSNGAQICAFSHFHDG